MTNVTERTTRTTIRMVAAEAGVSTAAVSYVLSGRRGGPGISQATSDRVRAAAEKLGYHRNRAARTIRTGRTNLVLLSLTMLSDPWSLAMAQAVSGELSGDGITPMILADADWSTVLDQQDADAVFIDRPPDSPETLKRLTELSARGVNLVIFSEENLEPDGFDVVRSPALPGCALAIDHLLEQHTKIGALSYTRTINPDQPSRLDPYVNALAAAGIELRQTYIEKYENNPQSAYGAAVRLLSLPDRPTAIYATTDFAAISAVQAAHRMGLRVPEDVSIIGAGNTPEGALMQPSLSSVGPSGFFEDVAALIKRRATGQDSTPGNVYEFPWTIMVRDSTRHT